MKWVAGQANIVTLNLDTGKLAEERRVVALHIYILQQMHGHLECLTVECHQLQLCLFLMLLNFYFMVLQGALFKKSVCSWTSRSKRPSTWRPCSVCLSLSHVHHCKTDNSLLWQHDYIFTCIVATIAVQVGMCLWAWAVFTHVFCLTALNSSLASRCFQGPLPSHAWWARDKCQRVNMSTATCLLPQWLHLVCTTCQKSMAAFTYV